jgi:hypothetical protein
METTPRGLWALGGIAAALAIAIAMGSNARKDLALPISGLVLLIILVAKPLVGLPVLAFVTSLVYFGWLRPVSTGRSQFTFRTWLALLALATCSGLWYWWNWSYGVHWQGATYTKACAIASVAIFLVVAGLGLVSNLMRRPALALTARWLAMTWVCTYGYPWLGELL